MKAHEIQKRSGTCIGRSFLTTSMLCPDVSSDFAQVHHLNVTCVATPAHPLADRRWSQQLSCPGFQEHLEACEDLFPQAEALRTILTIDMSLSFKENSSQSYIN